MASFNIYQADRYQLMGPKNNALTLSSHPFFSKLEQSELVELLKISFEKKFSADQVIVWQGDVIDAVYVILEGKVEVAKWTENPEGGSELVPQLVLSIGDAIGLTDIGFFSQQGVRTATLTALSDVTLIGWPIEVFVEFLHSHAHADLVQQSEELILRVNFIKKIALFTNLTTPEIVQIAHNVTEKEVPAGTVIFHQGDSSKECYLIQSGKVEISIKDPNGSFRKSVILEFPMIFGELALLADSPRNATATMIEEGKLLILNKKTFASLLHAHTSVAEAIVLLAMERSHPMRASDVTAFHPTSSPEQQIAILKHMTLKRYYQLSPLGWAIWNMLDGTQSIEDIIVQVSAKYGPESVDNAYNIIFDLTDAGFVHFPPIMHTFPFQSSKLILPSKSSKLNNFLLKLKKSFFVKFIFDDIDQIITRFYDSFVYLFFTKTGKFLMWATSTFGGILFCMSFIRFVNTEQSIKYPIILAILIFISNLLLTLLHELAHAFTVKSYRNEVHKAGVIFYWTGIFAFVDTSDMWLSNREARIKVDLAGPITDILLTGLAGLCAFLITNPEAKFYFIGLGLVLYYDVISNLNPINESDGYHILSGYLNEPKLRENALDFLHAVKPKFLLDKGFRASQHSEIYYWSTCFIFLLFNMLLAFAAQLLIRTLLPPTIFGISLAHLNWILPLLVIIAFIRHIQKLYSQSSV